MITPCLSHDALLADIAAARREADAFHLWWLGQSGFLLLWQDHCLLMDPYLSDSLTRKYANTDNPHVRMTELAVAPERLDFVNVVTSSHNHTDHFDAETLLPLMSVNPDLAIVVPAANREVAANRLHTDADRLLTVDDGQTLEVGGFSLHAIPSAHESVDRDELGRCRYLGYVVRVGDRTIYHCGDSVRYEGMAERLSPWNIDVALLPINGRSPQRRVAGNLWGHEAAALARDSGAKLAIPCHYEMFAFNTASTDEFVLASNQLGQRFELLRCGQRYSGR
jgi:L-ascorbate metabolism protein UlaG (beta-lactamase superfamily)